MTAGFALAPADPGREERELREYLGADYRHERLQTYSHQLEREFEAFADETEFYRGSQAYLYDLTAFAMTQTKEPYLRDLVSLVGPPPASVLDYGCGIGSDGLRLVEAGYDVAFADFANPSTRYLAWRLERRSLGARMYDLDRDDVPGGFDAAFAFDVLEHVDDPFAMLRELEARARLVVVNVLEPVQGDSALHRELPVRTLVSHARGRRLRRYRVYHGRSHLLAYAPEPARGLRVRARSWSEWARGRVGARREPQENPTRHHARG